jgi:hypothetical protein
MFSKITVLGRPGLAISTRFGVRGVGGHLLCQMIFALACGFPNSFSQPKKRKKGLNWELNPGITSRNKAQSKNWLTLAS